MSTSTSTSSSIMCKATTSAEAVSPYAPDRRRRGRDTVSDAPSAAASSTDVYITFRLYTYCRRLQKVTALCLALGILRTLYERRRGRRRGVAAAAESSSEDEKDDEDNGNYGVTFIPTDIGGMREALSLLIHRLVEIPSVVRRGGGWPWSSFSSQIFFNRCRSLLTNAADGRERPACGGGSRIQHDGDCTAQDDDHNLDSSRLPSAWRGGVDRGKGERQSPTPPPPPRHRSDVDSVLNFWYASSPSKSQKSLWMITDTAKLESTDALISFEFGPLLTRLVDSSCLRDEWSSASHYGCEGTLALILILDQFSRHILRHHTRVTKCCGGEDGEGESSKAACRLPSQGECDALALSAARHFHATFHDQIDSGRIPTVCRVFALLPYRHSGTIEDLKFVQSCVEDEMEVMGGEEAALLRRFRSATNRRMNVLLDEARRTTRTTTATVRTTAMTNAAVMSSETSNGRDGGHDGGPDAAMAFADDDILECFPREAPLTPEELVEAGSHPVVNVIRTFLLDRGLRPVDSSSASGVGSERLRRGRGRPRPRPRPRSRRGKTGVGGAGRDSGEEVDVGSSAETTLRSSPATGGEKRSNEEREEEEKVCGHDNGNDAVEPVRRDDEVPSPILESVFGTGRGGGGTEGGGDIPETDACNSETQRAHSSHPPLTPIIVSLSGGVDSMVIARALALLSDPSSPTYTFSIRIVGAHIDYANRPESVAEADYVARYCDAVGMKYRVRRIDEVTRGVTARDEYERVARAARYDFYRRVLKEEEEAVEACSDAVTGTGGRGESGDVRDDRSGRRPVGILLGHHRGDLRENVLSNACRGCGPLDLSGMTEVGTVEGVEVWRPLLPLEKDQVYDFAHRFGVPYFKDTTPLWSTRGKLRNRLLPLIQEVYGEGSMTNLSSLATESDSARALLLDSVLRPFLDEVRRRPMGVSFPTSSPWKERGPFFWRFVLRDVLHSVGRGIFSDGALASFLGRVGAHPVRPGWLQCRRDYAVYLDADGTVHVFHPETFPWAKDDQYDCAGQAIQLGRDNALQIGSWTVSAEEEQDITRVKASALLSQKAYLSMDDLMEGQLTYFLKVPRNCTAGPPLVVVKGFTRASRPHAWKSTDSRIQSTLPLVGNTDAAIERLDAEFSFQNSMIVRVDLTINGISMG